MLTIEPFKGLRYNPAKGMDIARLVAPPYDMISAEDQKRFYELDDHNVIRLILGSQYPEDTAENNRYTRSSETLHRWLTEGVLVRDEEKSIYVYDQMYPGPGGQYLKRRGFIALAGLQELEGGTIHPHERTMSAPKQDRLNLMLSCQANFSQVFSVYDDPSGEIDRVIGSAIPANPTFDITDNAGVRHTLFSLKDGVAIEQIRRLMKNKSLFIADGHHRYETALELRRIMRKKTGSEHTDSFDYVMMYFANMAAPGLTILPFHRLVRLPENIASDDVIARLKIIGELKEITPGASNSEMITRVLDAMRHPARGEHRFGIYIPPGFYLFTYRRIGSDKRVAGELVENLDVSVLHGIILEEALNGTANQAEITYVTEDRDVLEKMAGNDYQIAFLLNPTGIDQIRDIAQEGLRMPPKSTNFHPKLISGFVFNLHTTD